MLGFIAFTIFFYDVQDALEESLNMRDASKLMPNPKHIELRSEFLLKGKYVIDGTEGKEIHIVSRLADYIPIERGIFFSTSADFKVKKWRLLK